MEVFSSTALINLVKIMHPYCLQLRVEEGGETLSTRHSVFSQEQVWKYQRPEEGSDEEINVVSDDDGRPEEKESLRSVLWTENSPRKRKGVSFGAVQVSSSEGSLQARWREKNQKSSGEAPSDVAGDAEVGPLKKSLSLQQYRQRQRARAPLVEHSGNYTAKWPRVSGTPQELTPILGLQGPNSCDTNHRDRPTTASTSRLSACLDPRRTRRSRAESRICSPRRLSAAANPNVSSDPPPLVDVPLPGSPCSACSLNSSSGPKAALLGGAGAQRAPGFSSGGSDTRQLEPPPSSSLTAAAAADEEPQTEAHRAWRSAEASAGPGSARTLQSTPGKHA